MNTVAIAFFAVIGACALLPAPAAHAAESVVYAFQGLPGDGEYPTSGLLSAGGKLYGTTPSGGSASNDGTVFSVTPFGKETVLYSFSGGSDGAAPNGPLINVDNTLYGTTSGGGASGNGTVFAINLATNKEQVLYSFQGGFDGSSPSAGLINVDGTLYGTTEFGGMTSCQYDNSYGCGTVFSVTLAGKETVLHRFKGGKAGWAPLASLVELNGVLYGTTLFGGPTTCPTPYGPSCGTVFSVTTTGKETPLYHFKGGSDGANPFASLIAVNSALYGTTIAGGVGSGCNNGDGCGTVFSVTPSGMEKVVHSFQFDNNGCLPQASLLYVKHTLFGTTAGCAADYGAVFSLSLTGFETPLYTFQGGSDAAKPLAGLVYLKGKLYGTTQLGGGTCRTYGCGTVFSVTP
jgi:uncharacterized repeat protein (TIGR03803 family)